MKRIRVAYIVRDLNGHGGIQFFAKNTSNGIDRKLIQVKLLSWKSPLSIPQELIIRALPKFIGKTIYPYWFKQDISNVLVEGQWDLIHFWHIKSAMAVIDSVSLPYILTCHGSEILRPFIPDYQSVQFFKALEGASVITTNSQYTKDYLVKEYGISRQKVYVIHPGIDYKHFKLRGVANNQVPKIGTLTRLIPRKNVFNIIKALELLKDRGLEFEYYLAGTGFFSLKMRILAKLRRSTINWQYLGNISDKVKESQFYPSLDVFVLPPLAMAKDVEGFGIVFLEANASGVPVVAANTGGVSDAVKQGTSGLFADPLNPEDIADKIYEILNSKKNYKKSARHWAENFSQENTARQFQTVYEKLNQRTTTNR